MSDNLSQEHAKKPAIAHPSSSIMLLRSSKSSFEILMERRSEDLRFAPGAYVFPGGRVDEEDKALASKFAQNLDDGSYRIAAIRELEEETGVSLPLEIAGDMAYFSHWITPPQSPKRFETKFYLTHSDEAHEITVDGTETQEAIWVNPLELLAKEEEGLVNMMFPTRLNLMKLAQSNTIADAIEQAKKQKVVTIMPEHELRDGEMWFTIPKDAGYPIHEVKRENIFELMGVNQSKS